MLAVNGAMMKPSRSLMLTKVRFAESDSELNVYLCRQQGQVSRWPSKWHTASDSGQHKQAAESHPRQTHGCLGFAQQ